MTVIYAFLAIGIIIFLHELGHFMAAKFVGVPVEKFALGFDPYKLRLISFKPGQYIEILGRFRISLGTSDSESTGKKESPAEDEQTEYLIGLVPFGGYVKMTGENPEEDEESCPDGLQNKSPGARALVFVAGVVMNIISGFIFFIMAFSAGVEFVAPIVGQTAQGMPAWKAGLQAGDTIIEVDGARVDDYTEVMLSIALGERGTPVHFKVKRPSQEAPLSFKVPRIWDSARGMSAVGLTPPIDSRLAEDPPEGSVAQKAGLRKGDEVIGATLRGVKLPDSLTSETLIGAIWSHMNFFSSDPIELVVRRQNPEKVFSVVLKTTADPEAPRLPIIGVKVGGGTFVRDIAGGSSAAATFEINDQLLSIDGEAVFSMQWELLAAHFQKDSLTLKISRQGKEVEAKVKSAELLSTLLKSEIQWAARDLEVGLIEEESTLYKGGLRKGDLLLQAGTSTIYQEADLSAFVEANTAEESELVVSRGGEEVKISVASEALRTGDGITWRTFPTIGMVTPGGSAEKAGITAGSKIIRLGEKDIFSFAELAATISPPPTGGCAGADLNKPQGPVNISWLKPDGELQQGPVATTSPAPAEKGLRFKRSMVVVQSGISGSFSLGIKRSIITVQQVYATLRSLIRRDVEAKNLAGPVGIIHIFSRVAEGSLIQLLFWMGMVSMNLAVLNLLPIPILDGGHLFFLLIEKLKGSPVSIRIQTIAMQIAMILFLSLALYVTWNDIKRVFFGF
ncbi:MAG: site-2 protease family protein [Planctomycetota bacterium]|nr:site-2 protease family protein [Planctomycetota bacterium]